MKIDTVTLKKQVILHLPYLLFLLVFAKLGQTVRLAPGADASQKLLGLSEGFTLAFQSMWPGAALDWLVGLCGAVIMRLAVYLKGKDAKKYRKNVEYGSARWGSKTDIAPFMDQKPENNIILTQSEGLMMSGRPKNPANARNKNVLVVGGSGSGKTRYFCKPGLYSANCSYLVTDPKGELLKAAGGLLLSLGYEVRVFNLIDPEQSDCYNPFVYVREEKDVLSLIDNLIKNTTPRNASSNDPFWEKAEVALDSALMLYLIHEAPQDEQNFETMIYMMNFADVREEDEQYRSPLDMLFRALEEEQPAHVAVKQYKVFKQAAGDVCSK